VIPPDVKAAAELLERWVLREAGRMRAVSMGGPVVMLFELVGAVCNYFLVAVGVRPRC
jgi:hypothetical protein